MLGAVLPSVYFLKHSVAEKSRIVSTMRGKVAVVTGASSGIGLRTALDLAAAGACIVLAARREDRLQELIRRLGGEASGHSYRVTDVSKRAECQLLSEHVDERHGRCDVLINNAGFSRYVPLGEPGAVDVVEQVMATNFFGAVYCTNAFLPLLERSAPSHVVNVASVAGRLAVAGSGPYTASKFALVGWSESVAPEMKAKGIHLGLVEPGPVSTEGFPQDALVKDSFLRHVVAEDSDVSRAIMQAIRRRKLQRTVPRWYYLLQFLRLAAPPIYRWAQSEMLSARRPPR